MKQAKTIAIIFLALLIFGGCSNLNSHKDSQVEIENGKLIIPIELDSGIAARSAVPYGYVDATGNLFFAAALTEGTPVPNDLVEVESTVNGTSATLLVPFSIDENERSLTLHIYAFSSGLDITTAKDLSDFTSALLHGSAAITISAKAQAVTLSGTVILSPCSNQSGSVELKINIPPAGYSLATNCVDSAGNPVAEFTKDELPLENGNRKLSVEEVAIGSYTVDFLLQKEISAGVKKTVYTRTEVINVYPGMKTEKWFSGTYNDTITILDSDIVATYYVFTASSDYANDTDLGIATPDNENGNGTIGKPYATVQKAIDHIVEINDGSTQYTIYVDGEFEAEEGRNIVLIENNSDKALNISIEGLGDDDSKTTFTGNKNRVIYLYNSLSPINLTLKNLKITGASDVTARGAGICSESHNDSALSILNCEISNNATSGNGGGIALVKGSLSISGCKFESNSATDGGAGIYIAGNGFTLSGTVDFESNQEIYLAAGKTIEIGENFGIATDASSNPKKISVRLASYDADTPVLTGAIDQDVCDKFILLDATGTAESADWKIAPNSDNTAGVLKEKVFAASEVSTYLQNHSGQTKIKVQITDDASAATEIALIKAALLDSNIAATKVELELRGGITAIPDEAFNTCGVLEKVKLPSTIETIGASAFADCAALAEITFKTESIPATLGTAAFSGIDTTCAVKIPAQPAGTEESDWIAAWRTALEAADFPATGTIDITP